MQMHLNLTMMSMTVTHKLGSWADEGDGQLNGLSDARYWQGVAKTLEKGLFDGIFFADIAAASSGYKGGQADAIRYSINWPAHDPMPLIASMASVTDRLGYAVTLSTTGNHPYLAVRRLSSLDYLFRGRIGFNVVTGANQAEHRAVGLPQLEHDQRYDAADEFMDICYALWGGVGDGALVLDHKTRIFGDPTKVKKVEYEGKYYKCSAMPAVLPSRQGRPVIFQAGSSGRGLAFALKHAEVVFAIQSHLPGMKRYMEQIRAAAATQRTQKGDVKVMFGVQPVIGGTEAEAKARAAQLRAEVPLEAGLARLSSMLGIDFSQFSPDSAFEEIPTEGSRGLLAAFAMPVNGIKPTLRDVALNYGTSAGTLQIVGTPEQVADYLHELWRETGSYGFNLSPTDSPASVEEFVSEVVPLLQKRGIFRREYAGYTLRDNLEQQEG